LADWLLTNFQRVDELSADLEALGKIRFRPTIEQSCDP
jgi:hypothetical protein